MKVITRLATLLLVGSLGLIHLNAQDSMKRDYNVDGKRVEKRAFYKRGYSIKKLFSKLDLTNDQKNKLKDIRSSYRDSKKESRDSMKRAFNIGQFISKEGFDREGFVNQSIKRATIRIGIKASILEESLKVLTPKQRDRLVELSKEYRDKR